MSALERASAKWGTAGVLVGNPRTPRIARCRKCGGRFLHRKKGCRGTLGRRTVNRHV